MKTNTRQTHTPGPWKQTSMAGEQYVLSQSDHVIAKVGGFLLAYSQRQLANARLIAAAPELLDLLQRMKDAGMGGTTDQNTGKTWHDQISDAIAKAEGK